MGRAALDGYAVNLEMWWTDRPPLARVAAAAAAGFTSAEIWFWPRWDVRALAEQCARHGLAVAQIGGWDFEPRICDRANRSALRRAVEEAVEVADLLGTRLVNLNGPLLRDGEDPRQVLDGVVDALASVVDVAAAAGVTLMVEPMNLRVDHPGYALPTSTEVVAVCERVASPALGINWDLYHLQIAEGDLTGHLAEGIDHVAYVQIADHPGRHEPGTGEIDHPFVVGQVRSLGYDGPIGLECTPIGTPTAAVERVAALAAAVAEASGSPRN